MACAEVGATRPGPSLYRTGASASIYLFLNYLSYAMIFTPQATYFVHRACVEIGLDADHCHPYVDGLKNPKYDEAQEKSAGMNTALFFVTGAPQVAVCALLGCLGDAYGRRVPLLIPVLTGTMQGVIWLLVDSLELVTALLTILYFGGGIYVFNHATFASLADATQDATPRQRSIVFGMVEGALWVGLLCGPVLGGFIVTLVGEGNKIAFLGSTAVGALNLVITFFTYRETLDHERRKPFSWKRANPFASLALFAESRTTILFAGVMLFALSSQNGAVAMISMYAQKVSNISPTMLGLLQSVVLGTSVFGLLVCMPVIVRCMSLPKLVVVSCLNGVLCWLLLSIVAQSWQLFAGSAGLILTATFFPVVRVGMTNTFGHSRYGESLAAVGVLEQICQMVGPPFVSFVYQKTEATTFMIGSITVRSLACVACAILYFLASLFAMLVRHFPEESTSCASVVDSPLVGT